MKKGQIGKWLAAVALLTVVTACSDDEVSNITTKRFQFKALVERPGDGSKLLLGGDGTGAERILYWEYNDKISIGSDQTRSTVASGNADTAAMAWLYYYNLGSDYNGIFETQLPESSAYFLALHPYSRSNSIVGSAAGSSTFSTVQISLPATQGYRNDTTFDKQVYPLVAHYSGTGPWQLNFRSVGSIVRVQLFNSSGAASTISKIEFAERNGKRLNGIFTVSDYSSTAPYLTAAASPTSDQQKITIDCGDGVAFANGQLLTFYLVLPSISTTTTTNYSLTMTVTNTSSQTCTRSFTVGTKRNSITYIQAQSISAWGSGLTSGLSGNGTERRPFRVYTKADLQYLRDCYNGDTRTINGQAITSSTYIQIMRPDIKLHGKNSDWTAGISNFIGHLTYVPEAGSILNNSQYPLFASISDGGVVEGLRISSDTNAYSGDDYSPLCGTNAGIIRNCLVTNSSPEHGGIGFTSSADHGSAGICITNSGTISSCQVSATFTNANRNVAGVSLSNSGTITGCTVTDDMAIGSTGGSVSGICHSNSGNIRDCQFAKNISSANSNAWYGIVATNSGTVLHCSLGTSANIKSNSTAAGIVGTNATGGTVSSCYIDNANVVEGSGIVGGIVGTLTGGTVINCYVKSEDASVTGTTNVGGIVGSMTGGTVANSFAYLSTITANSNCGGGIVGTATGGTINNCYTAYYSGSNTTKFFGSNSATLTNCYLMNGTAQTSTTVPADVSTLLSNLNTNASSISGARTWVSGSVYPEFSTYSAAKGRR